MSTINEIYYGDRVSLKGTISNPTGATANICIKREDGKDLQPGKKDLKITSNVDAAGNYNIEFLIDEDWERFRTTDKNDKLKATITYEGEVLVSKGLELQPKPQIEIIECITDLDEGSDNGGSGGVLKGFVFEKEYEIKITKYLNDHPLPDKMKKDIVWEYTYINENGNTINEVIENTSSEKLKLNIDNLDLLGREISIYAHLGDKSKGASLTIFCHNRFKYFDRSIVEKQIQERVAKPYLINQGHTSLCGMACLFYILVKNDKPGYKKLAKTLHRTGKADHNDYTLEPNEDSQEEMYNINPYTSTEHPTIPEIDWIVMASARSKESGLGYTGKKGQDASAINWPWIMISLGKKLLGYSTVEMDYYKINKSYIRDFFDSDEKIRILEKDIDRDFRNGYEVCMMIDGDMMYNKSDYDLTDLAEYHWITYEGNLEILNSKLKTETDYDEVTNINFNVVTWGRFYRGTSKLKLSKAGYRNNYYGYLRLK